MSENKDREFVERVRRGLEAAARDLHGADLTRLRAARRAALHGAGPGVRRARSPWLWPVAGVVTAGLAATVVGLVWLSTAGDPLPLSGIENLELIAMLEQADLYVDADFYRWLAEQGDAV
jgi:hypothetical protein